MWSKFYKDYPEDTPLVQNEVKPGEGITGCEMHEINGWGHSYHTPKRKKPGLIRSILEGIRK